MELDDGGRAAMTLRGDPIITARTAQRLLDLHCDTARRCRPELSAADLDPGVLGTLTQAEIFGQAHHRALADAAYTVEQLGAALEGDADRLLQVAFAQRATESAAQARMVRMGPR